MKTAIYVEDGIIQLVITPESDYEKNCLKLFEEKSLDAKIFTGSFYDCRGGWVRQTTYNRPNPMMQSYGQSDDKSLILVARTDDK